MAKAGDLESLNSSSLTHWTSSAFELDSGRGSRLDAKDLLTTPSSSSTRRDPFQTLYETVSKHSMSRPPLPRNPKATTLAAMPPPPAAEPERHASKRISNEILDLRAANVRLKAQVGSLLNFSTLLAKAESGGRKLSEVKADSIAFAR